MADVEKSIKNGGYSPSQDDRMETLDKLRTASSINMSPELFEKLYLSPQNMVKGDLRKTFGNPTPIALIGLLVALMPLSCDLMGWRGAGGSGAASIGVYFFMGGILMLLGGILEWVLGNSFPSIVFCTLGGFWFSYGATLTPSFAAYASYVPADAKTAAEGLLTQGFNASLGFVFLSMGLLCLMFLVCSLRTNVTFVVIFISLIIGFALLTGGFWALAADYAANSVVGTKCLVGAGAAFFVASIASWYILFAILLATVDFPLALPVGDLSTVIKGMSDKQKYSSG
ncbi:hypothetical protein VE00_00526 [Pseudogymnoascus sp. WSF 3629]|nr:hypothetical protein VE00_00526 [Pseudogymnoascus sp. WSF 3629]